MPLSLPPLPLALGTGFSPAATVTLIGTAALGVATMHTTAGPWLCCTTYSGLVKLTLTTVQENTTQQVWVQKASYHLEVSTTLVLYSDCRLGYCSLWIKGCGWCVEDQFEGLVSSEGYPIVQDGDRNTLDGVTWQEGQRCLDRSEVNTSYRRRGGGVEGEVMDSVPYM